MDKEKFMITIEIPGREGLNISNIVFDYNGTLAVNGKMKQSTIDLLIELKNLADVYILTADTYGTVKRECMDLGVEVMTFPKEGAAKFKKEIVERLPGESICIGNGYNDIEMFKIAALSIGVIEKEGLSGKLLAYSDIVVNSIDDAFNLILNTERIKATLRS